jgi:hypothetical protein
VTVYGLFPTLLQPATKQRSTSQEFQQVIVEPLFVRFRQTVRRTLINLQYCIPDQLG